MCHSACEQLAADALAREDAIISNVIVSNDATYLWLVENPATAHENYILTSRVAAAIAHGSNALLPWRKAIRRLTRAGRRNSGCNCLREISGKVLTKTRTPNRNMPQSIPVTLIPGDGIGPEIVDATLAALDALRAPFEWDRQIAGLEGVKAAQDPLPPATLQSIRRTKLALKGPLETPSGGGYRSSNVRLREEFKLYANLRPARTLVPGGRFDNVDLVVVRENLEGLYIGHEHYVQIDDDPHAVAMATGINTRAGSRRLLEYAFAHAIATGRKKVTIVHKANIMKALTGIFLETAQQLYNDKYKDRIAMDTVIVDACAMKLVLNPQQFDVLVTTNLFGDILSDLVAGLVGGLGMAPGANIGADSAIFEAVHGSAPDITGKDMANPVALMLAAAMMLDHVKLTEMATQLRRGIDATLNVDKVRTRDLGGDAGTAQFTRALVARLKG
jgi:isocitrate dehydrogenase (NAD+)